ncbi:MAG: beta-lactamase family protein [Ruminococcaceae bacterium]|nr:beta-lactamase family protein [Oscillospiraceae bacterium]
MFENTKALCALFPKMGVPGFDLIVMRDGKEILRHMGGYMDLEKKIPVQGNELYNIYSCSKPITVTAAMQLWEKGLFDLEDEVSKYLPEFGKMTVQTENGLVPAERPILVRNLFTMTAGLSYALKSPELLKLREETEGRCATRDFARYLAREPLHAQPGTEYRYSLCHDVLAALVEVISGQKFEQYVKEHIFLPMGMTRSDFLLPIEDYDKVATLYKFMEGKPVPITKVPGYRLGTEHASGGAGCVSTVEDYVRFAEGLRTHTLLKKETVDLITKPWLNESEARSYPLNAYTYGLGMRMRRPGSAAADFGWGGAAGASLHIDRKNGISLYYSQHLLASPNQSIRPQIYNAVLKDLGFDVQVKFPDDETLNQLTY